MMGLPRGSGAGLERANPKPTGLQPGGWIYGFVLAAAGGAAIYTVEGWFVFQGVLPGPVVWLTIWGYAIWVTLTARAWYSRSRRTL